MTAPYTDDASETRPLHPGLVTLPASPPNERSRLGPRGEDGEDDDGDDGDDGNHGRFHFSVVKVFRAIMVLLSIAAMIVFSLGSSGRSCASVYFVICTFLVHFWNLFLLLPKRIFGRKRKNARGCSFRVGSVFCSIGMEDPQDGDTDPERRRRQRLRWGRWIERLVDLSFAVIFLAAGIVAFTSWAFYWSKGPVGGLAFTMM
jgi:hypothetical protein